MKFCMPHWNELRAEVDKLGLTTLIAEGGEEIIAKTAEQVQSGEVTIDNFDPLMHAHWAIVGHVAEAVGSPIGVIQHPGCPLCLIIDLHNENCTDKSCDADAYYRSWPRLGAESALAMWESLRL